MVLACPGDRARAKEHTLTRITPSPSHLFGAIFALSCLLPSAAAAEPTDIASAHGAASALVGASRRRALEATKAPSESARFIANQAALEARLGLELYHEGEDWRAISALERYRLLDRSRSARFLSALIIGQIYDRNDRPELAAASFERAVLTAPTGEARVWSYLLQTQQLCVELDYWVECGWRLKELDEQAGHAMPPEQREVLAAQLLFVDFINRRPLDTKTPTRFQRQLLRDRAGALLDYDARYDTLPLRRPVLAAVMSAALPGAGQAYNRQWGDALIALGLNAAMGAATYYSFKELDSVPLGVISASVLATFYAGNIINAHVDTSRHNAEVYRGYFEGAKRSHWPRVEASIEDNDARFDVSFGEEATTAPE